MTDFYHYQKQRKKAVMSFSFTLKKKQSLVLKIQHFGRMGLIYPKGTGRIFITD